MSPGRWALPDGMFSTSPMMPTTLALALRSATAFITPTTQAAPAMSPFMSSMPEDGLIEMPPVSKVTPLPMKATGGSPSAAVPPHDHQPRLVNRSLCHPQQRPHAELLHLLGREDLDLDPKCLEALRAAGEFLGIEDVGRLVDQIARQQHAVIHCLERGKGSLGGDRLIDQHGCPLELGRSLAFGDLYLRKL